MRIVLQFPPPDRPRAGGGSRRRALSGYAAATTSLAALTLVGLLSGCAPDGSEPSPGPATVGTRTAVCGDRVDVARAAEVAGRPLAELRELSTFSPGQRAGQCALQGEDGGAVLAVEVVRDPQGRALAKELSALSQTDDYTGDDRSGVAGDDRTTTALYAIDKASYVRVLGLGGTSAAQRQAALALAADVATRSEPIR